MNYLNQISRVSIKQYDAAIGSQKGRSKPQLFSTQTAYIDEWYARAVEPDVLFIDCTHFRTRFASIIKPSSFYERLATSEPARCYFYNVDLQGRLFLEETMPKNIATSIKDTRFLDFFFNRLQKISNKHKDFMKGLSIPMEDYPFVSPCGKELNFIRPAATPIVFHSIDKDNLVFAGSKKQLFDHARLAISEHTGRLYHEVTDFRLQGSNQLEYALIRSAVAVSLSDCIISQEDGLYYQLDNDLVPIQRLPAHCEPGNWSMPGSHYE